MDNSECTNIVVFEQVFTVDMLVVPRPVDTPAQTQIKRLQLLCNRYRRSSFSRNLIQLCVAALIFLPCLSKHWKLLLVIDQHIEDLLLLTASVAG